jgi:acyl carrier protein
MTTTNETPTQTADLAGLISAVFRETLLDDGLGLDSDFYEAGGDSLTAFQIIARLGTALDIEVPVALVFAFPTPRDLAGALTSLSDSQAGDDTSLN